VNPFFTIIIPTFNSAKFIEKCLNSVFNQTFSGFEILIIDGVSNDNTLDICKSYNDSRIKIISEKDDGIYDAMNKGIKLAKGNWLYFLGSDDILFNNLVLEKVAKFITKAKVSIVYGNVKINGKTGWTNNSLVYDGEFNLKKILIKNICHQAIFYSKSIFKDEFYNLKYNVCADYDLNLKLFKKYKFKYMAITTATFTGGGTSTINSDLNFNKANVVVQIYFWQLYKTEFKDYNYFIVNQIFKTNLLSFSIY
jgi:glycosyltransferase involved in cell wall biosynthesis